MHRSLLIPACRSIGAIAALLVFLVCHPAAAQSTRHADLLRSLNDATLKRGEAIYQGACAACHGERGVATLPTARSFGRDALKYGSDPYSMWKTVTEGRGAMAGQTWLTPAERYYVIQYIRETFMATASTPGYAPVTEAYLDGLPRTPLVGAAGAEAEAGAALGLQQWGQTWAQAHPGDYGRVLYAQLAGRTSDALTVAIGHDVHLSYDLLRMEVVAAWTGSLDLSQTKFHQYRGEGKPAVAGKAFAGLETWRWGYRGGFEALDAATSPRAPLPADRLRYTGHYLFEDHTLIAYETMGRSVLERPEAIRENGLTLLAHTLDIGPGDRAERLYVAQLPPASSWRGSVVALDGAADAGASGAAAGHAARVRGADGQLVAAFATGDLDGFRWEVDAQRRIVLHVPASETTRRIRVVRYAGRSWEAFLRTARAARTAPLPDLASMIHGGTARWNQQVVTSGRLDVGQPHYEPAAYTDDDRDAPGKKVVLADDYPYSVDEIGLPYANPWNAWIRPTALDFFPDGRLVLATYLGDIWIASGLDAGLETVRWQRIATGLYEPMGVRVVDGQIYVTARDRIVRLHDLNGDGETDFYESFYADHDVSSFFHSFAFGLQTDAEGNFYYSKAGQYTDNASPGNLMKVSPDGRRAETLATGFRTPNGVTVSPEGRVYVSDNQGNWMPGNKINQIKPGGYYGYVPNIYSSQWSPDGKPSPTGKYPYFMGPDEMEMPATFDEPMVWMPQELDNSPGGGTWSAAAWGPLGNRFIHSSFGKGWLYHVMPQDVGDLTQGAVVPLPFQFETGLQRVRSNPADGQIYTTGLTGWDDGFATKYGALYRVRYNGRAGALLVGARTTSAGVELAFNTAVDAAAAVDVANYEVLRWNYSWQQRYGSEDWSVANPDSTGRDTVQVTGIRRSEDGRTVTVLYDDQQPVDQVRVRFWLRSEAGAVLRETVYLTVHQVPAP
ncbi:MAG: DUF6797 domain-containing protein [Rhodothermales bacterium]